MIKRTITYVDYNGKPRTEDFRFHLTKAEALEMEFSVNGGLSQQLERIVKTDDTKEITEFFKSFILKTYGEISPDGRGFIKNQELRDAFAATEAYSILYVELATDATAAAAFTNGVLPDMSKELAAANATRAAQ